MECSSLERLMLNALSAWAGRSVVFEGSHMAVLMSSSAYAVMFPHSH